ncbi:MAG TPA: TM0106 family RecB-like putative nuclease [Pyrinomonadaceae bacterium]
MFSPSAIADFLACSHLTFLEGERELGRIKRPYFADPGKELLSKLGLEHEQKYLGEVKARGLRVVEVPTNVPWTEAAALTRAGMVQGFDVIYQATFLHDQWGGRADFLRRVDTSSKLGAWSYEVVETKLAKSTKARALIQLCFYSELVAAIQGEMPEQMHVVLGSGAKPEAFSVRRYLAYFRKVKREFEASIANPPLTYPEPVELCGVCDWFLVCDERWHQDDHLSLVAGITRNQRNSLVEREIKSVEALGGLSLPVVPRIDRIAPAPLLRIREQARVQVRGRNETRPVYEFIEPLTNGPSSTQPGEDAAAEALRGFSALPVPSPGDVFLDFESDPFAFDQGIEYLIGTLTIDGGQPNYNALWSFNPAQEKNAFIEFMDKVKQVRQQYPDMHIYHYSPYEQTTIKHLAGRHGVCTEEVDELLRAEVFVDLFRVVRQGLRASVESYSIKKMEQFYGFTRMVALRDATSSLQAIESVFALGDDPESAQETLKTIADYNKDDCLSTLHLREWLELLRVELETKLGTPIPRPELKSGAPGEDLAAQLTEIAALKERLVSGLPEEKSDWTAEQRACWLLAQLLEWHRREEKSMWWEYYRLSDLSDEELIEDKSALGGLKYLGVVEETKRSYVHRYQFPTQDHAIDRARSVHDPRTRSAAGTKVEIDEINRTIDLKREKKSDKPHPRALIPDNYVSSEEQVKSLIRLAGWVADNGLTNSSLELQAGRDALLHRAPRLAGTTIEVLSSELSPLEAAKRAALAIDHSILPIQGPPGSGKTFTGAHMIIELVQAGKRVGITAGSHKVISNLLDALCEEASELKLSLRITQKPDQQKLDGCGHDFVTQETDNKKVLERLKTGEALIVAGTPWLWAREEFAGSVDVLFVDEAGQMSLANVLAVSSAAKSVVLLGDPQQLDQPQKGVHPPGAEVSALSHLLNGRATIESHQGLFLGESWRLHPDVCEFTSETFYEGRLTARSENALQRLNTSKKVLDGTGLRFVPVAHSGDQSDSPEEVEVIASIVEELLRDGATWTNKKGETHALTWDDILIVAPYNAQVALLKQRLPDAKVGTVDKFQGQEAPVVFYSMATSTPEDAPRGMEFLYSANRLNVATSRAQCVTVLVASPGLFDVSCKTPRQMELANAFCRYLEMASVI